MTNSFFTLDYAFWLIIFSFYVLDNIKLLPKEQIVLRQNIARGYTGLIVTSRYDVAGKEIVIPNLFLPCSMIVLLKCNPSAHFLSTRNKITAKKLEILNARLRPFKFVSAGVFFLMLLGPVLTYYFGLTFTLILLIPIHLLFLMHTIILLVWKRKKLGLQFGKTLLLVAECVLVPAYLCNIVRRISFKRQFSADGYQFALSQTAPENLDELKYKIERKLDMLMEEFETTQSDYILYMQYKSKLGV